MTPLTPREERIAALVVEGLTNAEIAKSLSLAESTIEWHLTRVYRKAGVRSRTQLVRALTGDSPWAADAIEMSRADLVGPRTSRDAVPEGEKGEPR